MENIEIFNNTVPEEPPKEAPPAVDAVIHVSIIGGDLEAYMDIEPPRDGGAAPTMEMLTAALEKAGVTHHIDREKLRELAVEPVYNHDILVAKGIAPVNGMDGTATFQFETGKSLKPRENEDGTVDFHDLQIVENVTKGQVLCVLTLPTEGSPGISVKGKELPQKKGKPVPPCTGKNTELNQDGTAVLAKMSGQVEFDGRKIHVNETFFVRGNVDNSTGDILVEGSLDVAGMVLPGFKIEAGRHINVKGTVENAVVKAGGNIELMSGITGSELYCDGDLKCRFIEGCRVFVKGDITAEYILNSDIKCGKNVKTVGKRSKIIGGTCLAGQNIETTTVGSIANVKTKLELGTDYTVIERQQRLTVRIPELEKQIESLKPLIGLLRQREQSNRLTPDKVEILKNAQYSYDASMEELAAARKEMEEIAQAINNRGYGRIICSGTIFPGTIVEIGPTVMTINEALIYTTLYYDEGNIMMGVARR